MKFGSDEDDPELRKVANPVAHAKRFRVYCIWMSGLFTLRTDGRVRRCVDQGRSQPAADEIGPSFKDGRFTAIKITLKDLLMYACDMTAPRVIGPGWLDGGRFDVFAEASGHTSQDDPKAMLQTLLRQRFHLVAHQETREMSTYDLVVAK